MDELVDSFLGMLREERHLAHNTLIAYRNDLEQFSQFEADRLASSRRGSEGVDALTLEDVDAYVESLDENGYAVATVARKLAAVKTFLRYLHGTGVLDQPLGNAIHTPTVHRDPPAAMSQREVERLLALGPPPHRPEQIRDVAMLRLMCATGLRVGEIVGLNTSDVHYSSHTVGIRKGGRSARTLPIDDETMSSLSTYMFSARGALAGSSEAALFVNQRGSRLTRQGFWLILKERAKRRNLETLSPQRLRHTFAVRALETGVEAHELQKRLGHVSRASTEQYVSLVRGRHEEAGQNTGT